MDSSKNDKNSIQDLIKSGVDVKRIHNYIKQNSLSVVAFVIPIIYFILITCVFPRPYYIFFTDGEQTMYYGSKLVYYGFIPCDLSHPGMISYYIGALIMMISGPDIHKTQLFLQIGYFFVALATGTTMGYFSKRILNKSPFGIGLLSLVLFFCFSPVLMYSDMVNVGSLIFILAFLALIFFWPALKSENPQRITLHYCLTGIILGISLANHVVALILFSIVCMIGFIKIISIKIPIYSRLLIFLALPFSTIFSYFIFSLPVHYFISDIWSNVFKLDAIQPSLEGLLAGISALTSETYLLPETVTQIIIILVFFIVLGVLINREFRVRKGVDNRNWIHQALLLTFLFFAFLYTLSTSLPYGPGITVRYTMPFAALFSFALVFMYERLRKMDGIHNLINIFTIGISVVILLSSTIGFFQTRSNLITHRSEEIASNLEFFNSYNDKKGRIAFWDGSPGYLFGEVSFHLWGNYRYANDTFDNELLSAYPDYSFFKLRYTNYVSNQLAAYSQPNYTEHLPIWGRLRRLVFPRPCISQNGEIVSGELQNERISLIAFPAQQIIELQNKSIISLENLLNNRLGAITKQEISINGAQWYMFTVRDLDQSP